jgi:hypothetical protein
MAFVAQEEREVDLGVFFCCWWCWAVWFCSRRPLLSATCRSRGAASHSTTNSGHHGHAVRQRLQEPPGLPLRAGIHHPRRPTPVPLGAATTTTAGRAGGRTG